MNKKKEKIKQVILKNKSFLKSLSNYQIQNLFNQLKIQCALNGLIKLSENYSNKIEFWTNYNFSLFPLVIPESVLKFALIIQEDFNTIFDKLSLNHKFLIETLQNTSLNQDFISNMLYIYVKANEINKNKTLRVHVIQTTYSIKEKSLITDQIDEMLQFEYIETSSFNEISISSSLEKIHNQLIKIINQQNLEKKFTYNQDNNNSELIEGILFY